MWRGLLISFLDDLHLSDFREMRLKSKGDFDIAFSEVMGIKEIYSFQARGLAVPILKQTNHIIISHLRHFIALTGSSALLRNMTTFHLIAPYIRFQ